MVGGNPHYIFRRVGLGQCNLPQATSATVVSLHSARKARNRATAPTTLRALKRGLSRYARVSDDAAMGEWFLPSDCHDLACFGSRLQLLPRFEASEG